MDRRDFLKLLGVGAGAAAAAGCNLDRKSEKLIPYLVPPEDGTIPGEATYTASTCTECPGACGTTVKVQENLQSEPKEGVWPMRPVKVDGLDGHPLNDGALCMRGQASINRLYHPDRIAQPLMQRGNGFAEPATWAQGYDAIKKAMASSNRQHHFLSGQTSGSFSALVDTFCSSANVNRLPEYELLSHASIREANDVLFGRAVVPTYRVDRADFLLTLGVDLTNTFQDSIAHHRSIANHAGDDHFSWYHLEPHVTLTGLNAPHRFTLKPGSEVYLLWYMLAAVNNRVFDQRFNDIVGRLRRPTRGEVASNTGLSEDRVDEITRGFLAAKHPLVISGEASTRHDRGLQVALATSLLQYAVGSMGDTVDFDRTQDWSRVGNIADMRNLADELKNNRVGVLFVFDTDPVSQLPFGEELKDAMDSAELVVGVGTLMTPTLEACDVVFPLSHALEAWGDRRSTSVVSVIQPTFEPIHDTRSEGDVLMGLMADLGRPLPQTSYQAYVLQRWTDELGANGVDALLRDGYRELATPRRQLTIAGDASSRVAAAMGNKAAPSGSVVVKTTSIRTYDGRSAVLPLLQEIPDPLTTITWEHWVSVSPITAASLGVKDRDMVTLSSNGWSKDLPAKVQPGLADGVFMVQEDVPGIPAAWVGDSGEAGAYVSNVTATKSGGTFALPINAGSTEDLGRGIVPGSEPAHFGHHHVDPKTTPREEYSFNPDPMTRYPDYKWAMAIDMDLCSGCSACVAACYIENNVPVVGPEEHLKGRELSWIRIEPYYDAGSGTAAAAAHGGGNGHGAGSGGGADGEGHHYGTGLANLDKKVDFVHASADDVHAEFLPMMCQHCDEAPCEPVCPVYATYHNTEGLNVQVYNRCVGTRYCANNCPYKLRRFNWFDPDRPYPLAMMTNPEVSVRGKGIMEKCSFCAHKIRKAKEDAKDHGGLVKDGEVVPACMATCPGDAIVFGNLKDPKSKVSQWAKNDRAKRVLEELGTSPSVYYLASKRKGDHHGQH